MQPYLSNYYGATRFVLEKWLKIDPIKKPGIYLDINPTEKHVELVKEAKENMLRDPSFPNPRDFLDNQEKDRLRRMTLGKDLDRFVQ